MYLEGVFTNRIDIVRLYAPKPQYDPIIIHKSTRMYYALGVFTNRIDIVRLYVPKPQYDPTITICSGVELNALTT